MSIARLATLVVIFGICVDVDATEPRPYRVGSPDILKVSVGGIPKGQQPLSGEQLIRPDGTISLGTYGHVSVDGQLVQEIEKSVKRHLMTRVKNATDLDVDVSILAHNSHSCYLIVTTDDGKTIHRLSCVGNEKVADAILDLEGASKLAMTGRVWLSRRQQVLNVDWRAITQDGKTATNYRLSDGDRVYIDTRSNRSGDR